MADKHCRISLLHAGGLTVAVSAIFIIALIILMPAYVISKTPGGASGNRETVAGYSVLALWFLIFGGIILVPMIYGAGVAGAAAHNLMMCKDGDRNKDWIGLSGGIGAVVALSIPIFMFIRNPEMKV